MSHARTPFGQIFLTTVAAAVLGVLAFHMTDLVTLRLKGITVQAAAIAPEPGKDYRPGYRYTVDGKDYQTGSSVLLPLNRPAPGQVFALRYLKADPAKTLVVDDFVQAMIETGLGMLIAVGALGLLRWRGTRPGKNKSNSSGGTK